jgi:uncharacterized protein
MKPDNIILEGITGSKAYGLDTPTSDTDIKGIYVVPTENVLTMGYNFEKATKDHTDPDWSYHEVQKFMQLAMECNPTVLEMLFLEDYTVTSEWGKLLIANRDAFLWDKVAHSYGGYALSQARDLNRRGYYGNGRSNRKEKHTRHCFRLLYQGRQLLETGDLTVRVTPEVRAELFALGESVPVDIVARFEEEYLEFKEIKTVLPNKPDKERINKMLLEIRRAYYS